MDKVRTLGKTVDPLKLTAELKALAPTVTGLCYSSAQVGDELRVVNADDLSDNALDAAIAAHTPRTANQLKDDEADGLLNQKVWIATLIYLMKRLNELRSAVSLPPLTGSDVRTGIRAEYRNL